MSRRSPTFEGFATIFREPSFGFAEIAWRWSFGFAATFLLILATVEYLDTLPVTGVDTVLLQSGLPVLVWRALQSIFQGSSARLVLVGLILIPTLALGWVIVGSLGRAATLKALVGTFREEGKANRRGTPYLSLFGLNFLRLVTFFAALVGCLGALMLAGLATSSDNPAPGSAFLIFLTILLLVWLAWSVVNWFLSLSSVFVFADGQDTFGALSAAVGLCRTRTGSVIAAGTWFGLAHIVAFFIATSVVTFPLAFAGVLPLGVVLAGVLVVTLLYFAVADFLYIGRLAAYVAMVEVPAPREAAAILPPPVVINPPATGIDQEELILSDAGSGAPASLPAIPPCESVDQDEPILSDEPPRTKE